MSTNKKDETKAPLNNDSGTIEDRLTSIEGKLKSIENDHRYHILPVIKDIETGKRDDFTRQLMEFRTTYIRAVARASIDPQFRAELTSFKEKEGKQEPQALSTLQTYFGYDCPWPLTLALHDNILRGPRLNPADGRVMTLPYWGESITVFIPPKSKVGSDDAKVQLDALAAYYHQNPWFLQPKQGVGVSWGSGELPNNIRNPPPVFEKKWSSVKSGRYDLGANINDFISFAGAIFNAVALAWENEVLWNELTSYKAQAGEPRARTIGILNEWLGYNYPWELDLIIEEDKEAKYGPSTAGPAEEWTNLTPPVLMLTLPWMSGVDAVFPELKERSTAEIQKLIKEKTHIAALDETARNQNNPGVAIMGLALYNTDGPGYPFTCG